MSIIKPQSKYLKVGVNVEEGDIVKFLNEGEFNEGGQYGSSWEFVVGVIDGKTKQNKAKKLFTLNNTNIKAMTDAYGEESSNWVGKTMIVRSVIVQTATGEKEGIRLKAPAGVNPIEEGNDKLNAAQEQMPPLEEEDLNF